jgi:DNA repair protein RecO (recombination protein O)
MKTIRFANFSAITAIDKPHKVWYLNAANAIALAQSILQHSQLCGSGSVVEHFLAKEDVAGSSPVSRSPSATSPSGKARLCKSCISGSNPLVASRRDVLYYHVSFFVISQENPSMREQRSYSTESVILKHSDLGEADRIVTLFTPYKGKFHAVAKGVRRPISKKTGHLELLCHSQLQVAVGRNLDIVTQAQTIEPFHHLRLGTWYMTCGGYLSELIDRFIEDDNQHTDVYQLLLEALRALEADAITVERQGTPDSTQEVDTLHIRSQLLLRYFEINLLSLIGYEPVFRACANCNSELQPVENGFTPTLGGVLCPNCSHLWSQLISANALKVLRILQRSASWQQVPRLRLDARILVEVELVMHGLLRFHLERDLKSWSFLEMLSIRHS